MKKMFPAHLLLSLCTLSLIGVQSAHARSLADIRSEGVLHVGSLGLPPFSYKTPTGYAGFETELITALAADLGVKTDFAPITLDTVYTKLNEGGLDAALGGIGITSTRANKVLFTRPFLCAGMSVVSPNPDIQTRFDLENRTIAVLSGSTTQAFVQKLPFPKKAVVFTDVDSLIYAMTTGKVDATLNYKVAEPIMNKIYPKAGSHFGPVQWIIPVGAMLPEGDSTLRLALNANLYKMLKDGRYAALSTKYFAEDPRCKA